MTYTYRPRIADTPAEINAADWDGLLARQARPTPFLRHAFLHALDATGCATAETGWQPQFVTLWRDGTRADGTTGEVLAAAAPLYVKSHSYGEYVFDWAWADAYQRNGLDYYPKLLCAVPFTPVTGTRLMAEDDAARAALARALVGLAGQAGQAEVSSLHILFPDAPECEILRDSGMKLRSGVQFHWLNAGYRDFEAFLATLEQKKRKNIRAERRKVHEAGVRFRHVPGADATEADWQFFVRCYRRTYREHHSSPYLNLEFFLRLAASMPDNLLLVIAEREGRPIASSLLVYQREPGGGTLYGRYWGAIEQVPCLHFETAYYQPLEFCIAQGIATFEGGAQGEHKMARGFLPTVTHSAHWLAHPAFADAIERFLERESGGIDAYVDELRERNPFKAGVAPAAPDHA